MKILIDIDKQTILVSDDISASDIVDFVGQDALDFNVRTDDKLNEREMEWYLDEQTMNMT